MQSPISFFDEGARHAIPEALGRKEDRNMKETQVKLLSPDHPISIHANPSRVVVSVTGTMVAVHTERC